MIRKSQNETIIINVNNMHVICATHLNFKFINRFAHVVKFMVSTGMLLTFPLQFFVAIQIMWSWVLEKHGPLKHPLAMQLLFRTIMVLITCKHGLLKKHQQRKI